MFNKEWFLKHQKILLWFANTFIGKRVLRHDLDKVDAILPNAVFTREGKKITAEFRTHNKYSKRLYYAFKPLWHLFHLWDMAWYPKCNLGFDSLTKYPDANPESTSVDGHVRRSVASETFGTIRAGAGTNSSDTETEATIARLVASSTSNQYSQMRRAIFLFDTSALTAEATISAATLSLYGSAKSNGLGSPTLDIVSSTPVSSTALVNADYAQLGTTVFSDIAYASFSTSAYNDMALNASGLAAISKTSISKFGTRIGWDTDNSFGGVWASTADTYFQAYFADQAGTTNDPKLVVTYTLPSLGVIII